MPATGTLQGEGEREQTARVEGLPLLFTHTINFIQEQILRTILRDEYMYTGTAELALFGQPHSALILSKPFEQEKENHSKDTTGEFRP